MSKRKRIQPDIIVSWDIKYFGLALGCDYPIVEAYSKVMYRCVKSKNSIKYYRGYLLHREDGPAIESENGTKEWFLNGDRHREDGPAIEYANGGKEWWRNDRLERKVGPSIEYPNGFKAWYRNGHLYRWERI